MTYFFDSRLNLFRSIFFVSFFLFLPNSILSIGRLLIPLLGILDLQGVDRVGVVGVEEEIAVALGLMARSAMPSVVDEMT